MSHQSKQGIIVKRLRNIGTVLLSLLLIAVTLFILMEEPAQSGQPGQEFLDGTIGMIRDSLSLVIRSN